MDQTPDTAEPTWEIVCRGTKRLRVPGGWLYRIMVQHKTSMYESEMVAFVPTPVLQSSKTDGRDVLYG